MIKKICATYIDEAGKKTGETLVLEIAVNNKGQPDFKQKSEVFGYCKVTNEDTGQLETYPFFGIYVNEYVLADFGDTFNEYSKENLESTSKPKFCRYFHIPTGGLDPKVGKNLLLEYSGQKFPYQITRVEDFK